MLGYEVSQAKISRCIRQCRGPRGQTWKTFLANHAEGIASVEFLVVPTISFDRLFAFVILRHTRRQLVHVDEAASNHVRLVVHAYGILAERLDVFDMGDAGRLQVLDKLRAQVLVLDQNARDFKQPRGFDDNALQLRVDHLAVQDIQQIHLGSKNAPYLESDSSPSSVTLLTISILNDLRGLHAQACWLVGLEPQAHGHKSIPKYYVFEVDLLFNAFSRI